MTWADRRRQLSNRAMWALVGLVLWLGAAAEAPARSLKDINASGEIRACIAPIHPSIATAEPADCEDDCAFSGPAYEKVLAFAGALDGGIKPVFRRVGWDEQFYDATGATKRDAAYTPALLASGACDIYPNHLTVTDWRLKKLAIVPLFRNRMMVIVNKAQKDRYAGPDDLAGKVSAVQKDTSFHSWLQAQNKSAYASNPVKIRLVETASTFTALDAGEIDFVLTDANAAIWAIRHQLKQAAVAFPVGATEHIGWGMRKQDEALQARVAAFFAAQKSSQTTTFNRIWEDHYGVSLTRFEVLVKALK